MDYSDDFRLNQAADLIPITKRNMSIWAMCMNRLGLPETLHEPVYAIYVSGNWQHTMWDKISIMRMARALSTNENVQIKIANRLKKSLPKFFQWQSEQSFQIVDRVSEKQQLKTIYSYAFLLYDILIQVMSLPENTPQKKIRAALDFLLKDYPEIGPPLIINKGDLKKMNMDKAATSIIQIWERIVEVKGSTKTAAEFLLCYPEMEELRNALNQGSG